MDEFYVGPVPPRVITFSRLNDNITKNFMEQLCGQFGRLERTKVYYHPKTNKHMGLAKVSGFCFSETSVFTVQQAIYLYDNI